jgi:hypothetical protein
MGFLDFINEETLNEGTDHPVFKKGDDTRSHVLMSLHRGGYSDMHEIHKATFSHMSPTGHEVHEIHYPSPKHEGDEEGHVYVDQHGKADF